MIKKILIKTCLILSFVFYVTQLSYANQNTQDKKQTNKIFSWFSKIFNKEKPKNKPIKNDSLIPDIDYVVVNKSQRKMHLKKDGKIVKTFNIVLGTIPVGRKRFEGDLKTPEGVYRLGFKNAYSEYYKSIKISYPNKNDIKHAKKNKKKPGGDIFIHGMPNKLKNTKILIKKRGKDWTEGCIALNNSDMTQFWNMIRKPGILIQINP